MILFAFEVVAVWMLPLPLWLQICLTTLGSLHILFAIGRVVAGASK